MDYRRQHERFLASCEGILTWQLGERAIRSLNLSAGGALVWTDTAGVPNAGAQVELELRLAGHGRVRQAAVVRWRNVSATRTIVGVEFSEPLEAGAIEAIREFGELA